MTLSKTRLSIKMLIITALSVMTLSKTRLTIMTLRMMTLGKMTFSTTLNDNPC
jgi:hypothetical protein